MLCVKFHAIMLTIGRVVYVERESARKYPGLPYLVKWKGYSEDENTWEPLSNLKNATEAIKEFDNRKTATYHLMMIDAKKSNQGGKRNKSRKQSGKQPQKWRKPRGIDTEDNAKTKLYRRPQKNKKEEEIHLERHQSHTENLLLHLLFSQILQTLEQANKM